VTSLVIEVLILDTDAGEMPANRAISRTPLPASHPILAEITIDPVRLYDLERLNADNPDTRIVGHDEPHDGQMTVYIACASEEVRRRLEDGWG
jgi:hypothetical protein